MGRKLAAVRTPPADENDLSGSPLFSLTGEHAYTAISREDPEEGFLGKLPRTATESDIRRKYGGGTFSLSARGPTGKLLAGGHLTLEISGDPIFQSRAAENKWRRQQGLALLDDNTKPAAAPAPTDKPPSLYEMMLLLDKQGEKSRLELREAFDQRQREAQQQHERQLEIVRLDASRRDADVKAERERERERQRIESERIAQTLAADRARDQQFMQTMISIVKSDAKEAPNPVGLLLEGIKLARDMGGNDSETDPVAALMGRLPEVMGQLRMLASSPKPGAAAPPAAPPGRRVPGKQDPVVLAGDLGARARRVLTKIQAAGGDPEKVLDHMFAHLETIHPDKGSARAARPAARTAAKAAAKKPAKKKPPAKATETAKAATK